MSSKSIKTVCPYCGVGCGMTLTVEGERVVKVAGNKEHPTNFGRLCTKGSSAHLALRESGRLERAFVRDRRDQDPVPTPMDRAIAETARRLRAILDEHGPDALSFYVSGQMSFEAQYLINKLSKGFVGTNNIESNSRLCMASAGSGYKLSLGADGPPGSYQDMDQTDLFFVIGANMADCHPILLLRLMDRVKAGAKLIVVDPRRNATADKSHLFMQIKPGTDLVLLNGLLNLLVKNGHTDPEFIAQFTEGWEAMPTFLEDYPPEKVAELTGIPEADIRQAAQMMGEAGTFMSCWTMGLNQSTHGTWNTNAICNLHLATGQICKPGAGPFSLTGQPNAMGGREMGYMGPGLPGQRSVLVEKDREFIENLWGLAPGALHTRLGGGTVDMYARMAAGEIKACWIICTNPVATVPNRKRVIEALQKAELVITQDAFLDTETNRYADILLPGALWAEAEGVMINSERNMTLMQKALSPPGEALPDWQIIARVACEMGFEKGFTYVSSEAVFEEIKRASNAKTGYDLRGSSYTRLRETPLQWPCPPEGTDDRNPIRYLNDGVSQYLKKNEDGSRPRLAFPTASGKGVFFARPHMDPAEMPDPEFPIVLNTGRLQHQWHTLTKTGKIPMLNKLNPGPFVEIHPEDAAALGIKDKSPVEVRSRRGRAVLPAVVTDRVRAGNCFSPFHWNDVYGEELAINAVTNDAIDPLSQQPEFKFCAVALAPVAPTETLQVKAAQSIPSNEAADASTGISAFKELDMSRINALASLLGVAEQPVPVLSDTERGYLGGFISGLRNAEAAGGVPVLPPTAPLTPAVKLWLDGLLAGLFSRVDLGAPLLAAGVAAASALPAEAAPKVTLLWASQTGKAEALAGRYAKKLEAAGCAVSLASMADFKGEQLAGEQNLMLISSTFGDGDPPDNGQGFWSFLTSESAPKLPGLRYGVLALGDPSYDQFCGHGKKLDARLGELGATALLARADCDTDFETKAEAWIADFIAQVKGGEKIAEIAATPTVEVIPAEKPSKAKPHGSRLLLNLRLNHESSSKETRCFSFDTGGEVVEYEAGDALGVWPRNCPELVTELLEQTRLKPEAAVTVEGRGELALAEALASQFEIARPSTEALEFIAGRSKSPELKAMLGQPQALKDWLWGRQLADVLHEYPVDMSAEELLAMLRKMQPRLYSISSSPKAQAGQVHLTVSVVRYDNGRKLRKGVSSTFLADRAGTDATVPVFVQKSAHFRLPEQGDTPIIMVGPGTGVAPFRGFLHERRARGDSGSNWLFFGEQKSATDFYYREEMEAFQKDGLLTRLDQAFSRDQADKVYVQDRMREQGRELWRWLEAGARFYVCGDASRMAKDVDAALKAVVAEHGSMSAEQAQDYVAKLGKDKRYLRDVY